MAKKKDETFDDLDDDIEEFVGDEDDDDLEDEYCEECAGPLEACICEGEDDEEEDEGDLYWGDED